MRYDLSKGSAWGRAVYTMSEADEDGLLPVTGCLTPLPKEGDTVIARDGSLWEFTHVEAMGNPRDGFCARLKPSAPDSRSKHG